MFFKIMKTPALKVLSGVIASFCKKNELKFSEGRGRKPKMSFEEVLTVFVAFLLSRRKDFKSFYHGLSGFVLREFFPKLVCYSSLLRRLQKIFPILNSFINSNAGNGFFIVDSTSFKLCESIRFKQMRLFRNFAGWAYSSTRCIYGFKLHIAIDEKGKIVAFRFTNGSRHDIKEAEELLKNRTGTAISDKGYCSQSLSNCFARKGLRFIVPSRRNAKKGNTQEEKELLRKRNLVERIIGKLKRHIGDSFSRFRAWGAVSATIAIGILTLNLGY
jgi:hypothetical protein